MARFYYTADGSSFEGPYFEGRNYTLPATPPGNGAHLSPAKEANEANGLYLAVEDNTLCDPPDYYFRDVALTMQGALLALGTTVLETVTCRQIPIENLYETKRAEIANKDQAVRYNAVDTALSANWWLVVTQNMRNELYGIQGNWLQRQQDGQGWAAGPNAPWVGIYNAANQRSRRYQITVDTQWDTLFLEMTQHDQATGNATDASLTALDAAYDDGAGDWSAVAAHNAADPAWGYPPTIELSPQAVVLFGR